MLKTISKKRVFTSLLFILRENFLQTAQIRRFIRGVLTNLSDGVIVCLTTTKLRMIAL